MEIDLFRALFRARVLSGAALPGDAELRRAGWRRGRIRPTMPAMRTFATIILGIGASALFTVFVLANAALDHTTDTDTVVDTAREADLRGTAIRLAHEIVRRELADIPDPATREALQAELGETVESAISPAWFYRAVATGHRGLLQYLEHGRDDTAIELGEQKATFRAALLALGEKAAPGEDAGLFRREVDRALRQIPDRTNLTALILMSPEGWRLSREQERARVLRALRWARIARVVALVGLAVALILIVLVNARSFRRALRALGGVLVAAGLVYLLGSWAIRAAYRDTVEQRLEAQRQEVVQGDPLAAIGAEGIQRVTLAIVDRITGPASGYAIAALLFGGGLMVLGSALGRR